MGQGDTLRQLGRDIDIGAQTFLERSGQRPRRENRQPKGRSPQQPMQADPLAQQKIMAAKGAAMARARVPGPRLGEGKAKGKLKGIEIGEISHEVGGEQKGIELAQMDLSKPIRKRRRKRLTPEAKRARQVTELATQLVGLAVPEPSVGMGTAANMMSAEDIEAFRQGKPTQGFLLPLSALPPAFREVVHDAHGPKAIGFRLGDLNKAQTNLLRTMAVNHSRSQP